MVKITVGSGINAQLGALKETTYGTGVTPSKFVEFVSESMSLNLDRLESKGLRASSRVERSGRSVANLMGANGDITVEVATKGMGWLWELALGVGAITTPTSGVLTRDLTFNLADAPPSATIQIGRPTVLNVNQPFTYTGCMCTSWEVSCDVDGILELKMSLDAQNETTATALATATYATGVSLLSYLGGQVTVGGTPYDVKKFSIKGDNGLATDRRFLRNSGLKKQPIPADFTALTVDFTVEFTDLTFYTLFTAGTLSTFDALFRGPQIEVVTPTYYNQLDISAPVVRIDGSTPNVGGPGILELNVTGTILHDPTVSANPVSIVQRTTDVVI